MSDNPDTIKIHKMINGKLYPLELRRQRFENVMDRIDRAVDLGAGYNQIKKQFADHIVSTSKAADISNPASAGADSGLTKSQICDAVLKDNPEKPLGELSKIVSANNPHISYANARYLLLKLMNNS